MAPIKVVSGIDLDEVLARLGDAFTWNDVNSLLGQMLSEQELTLTPSSAYTRKVTWICEQLVSEGYVERTHGGYRKK